MSGVTLTSLRQIIEEKLVEAVPEGFEFTNVTITWSHNQDAWTLNAQLLPKGTHDLRRRPR